MAAEMSTIFFELTDAEIVELCQPLLEKELEETTEFTLENNRDESVADVDAFIESQKKKNTAISTNRDVKNVQRWLWDNKREPKLIQFISPEHLNVYLAEVFIGIRKKDGSEYEPGSLEAIKNSIERYLKDNGYAMSIRSRIFHKANEALKSKKMDLKKKGKGRKTHVAQGLSQKEENRLFEAKQLGPYTPQSLQFSLFYFFGKVFGFRGRDEHRKLRFGDITLGRDIDGADFLEWAERDSKTRDGSRTDDLRLTTPRLYGPAGSEESRNPLALYRMYVEARPQSSKCPERPFFFTPIPEKHLTQNSDTWYYPTPMGEHRLGELMKKAAEAAGLPGRITNHSVRKTTVQTLIRSGVAPHKVMQVTEHKSLSSIQEYHNKLLHSEPKHISHLLQSHNSLKTENNHMLTVETVAIPPKPSTALSCTSPSVTSSRNYSSLFSGAVLNNCTFNFKYNFLNNFLVSLQCKYFDFRPFSCCLNRFT